MKKLKLASKSLEKVKFTSKSAEKGEICCRKLYGHWQMAKNTSFSIYIGLLMLFKCS